eukprot:253900_1
MWIRVTKSCLFLWRWFILCASWNVSIVCIIWLSKDGRWHAFINVLVERIRYRLRSSRGGFVYIFYKITSFCALYANELRRGYGSAFVLREECRWCVSFGIGCSSSLNVYDQCRQSLSNSEEWWWIYLSYCHICGSHACDGLACLGTFANHM